MAAHLDHIEKWPVHAIGLTNGDASCLRKSLWLDAAGRNIPANYSLEVINFPISSVTFTLIERDIKIGGGREGVRERKG